jgi:hypothetical protein
MSQTRLDYLNVRLEAYKKAEMAILDGAQSYQIGSRKLQRADLAEIRAAITDLELEVAGEQRKAAGKGRIRTLGVIPRDF